MSEREKDLAIYRQSYVKGYHEEPYSSVAEKFGLYGVLARYGWEDGKSDSMSGLTCDPNRYSKG